jgi:hypothetical protein
MTEVITYDFEEFECMQHQNIANQWYKTGQPRITIVMETPEDERSFENLKNFTNLVHAF